MDWYTTLVPDVVVVDITFTHFDHTAAPIITHSLRTRSPGSRLLRAAPRARPGALLGSMSCGVVGVAEVFECVWAEQVDEFGG